MQQTDHSSITLLSPAKINLFLHITAKRDDGYHNLQTLFYRVNTLYDTLTISRTDTQQITLQCSLNSLNNADNIVIKAARLLQAHSNTTFGCTISLDKKIPLGGGLGGGSSNAASVLLGLNTLWQLNLPLSTLLTLARQLGADVPFFVLDTQAAWAEGIGELLTPMQLPALKGILLMPAVHIPTAKLFAQPNLITNSPALTHTAFDVQQWLNSDLRYSNNFQPLVMQHAAIAQAMQYLADCAIGVPRLTGTGACVYVAMADTAAISAQALADLAAKAPCPAVVF